MNSRDLIRWWTETEAPAFETISAAAAALRETLDGKRVLLVVDDVWDPQDLEAFRGLASPATLLVTTRDRRNLPSDCTSIEVDQMEPDEATTLLGRGLPGIDPRSLASLARRLGEWPLLLGIVNRHLRDLVDEDRLSPAEALEETEAALEEEGLEAFDRDDTRARNQAVRRTLEVSLRRLSEEDRDLYERLAIFPEGLDVPLAMVAHLWDRSLPSTRRLARRFHRLSLLRDFDARLHTLRLHDVLREYLRQRRRHDLADLPITAVAVLPDGCIVSASHDRTLRIWDPEGGKQTARLEGHERGVRAVAVLPDGRIAGDRTLRIWNPEGGRCLAVLDLDAVPVGIYAMPPDGSLAVGDAGGGVHFIEVVG